MTPEQEFRKLLFSKIDQLEVKLDRIDKEMTTLKVKVALFSTIAGSIAALIADKLLK